MPQPHKRKPKPQSCLLSSLHHHISHNHLSLAVDLLPLLARRGLRPPSPLLSSLLRRCLAAGDLPSAHRLRLFLRLSALNPSNTTTQLSNHLLALRLRTHHRPSSAALRLFARIPAPNVFTHNALLAGLPLPLARNLFDEMPHRDLVSYNTHIISLARNHAPLDSLRLYSALRRQIHLPPNPYTFSGLLAACVRLADLLLTRASHAQVLLFGFGSSIILSSSLADAYSKSGSMADARNVFDGMLVRDVTAWTILVYGYARCGDLATARGVFDAMPERSPVSWTAMIGGYARVGLSIQALDLFQEMVAGGARPDQFTYSSSLCACAAVASLNHGKQIHARLFRSGFSPNAIVLSSLMDMYSKCGDLTGCRRLFDCTDAHRRDSVMWNTVISAVGHHRNGRVAIRMFEEMVRGGTKPNGNTFVVLLTACSHSGLVSEGVEFFESMAGKHGVLPEEEHYVCLVDMLGRAGCLEEAIYWLRKMPCQSSARAWNALLGACRIHGKLQLGSEAADRLIESGPQSSATYVLLSNIYAEAGRWESAEKVRHSMEEKNVRKERAVSWISIDNTVHCFRASDELHPSKDEIYASLEHLLRQMDNDSSTT